MTFLKPVHTVAEKCDNLSQKSKVRLSQKSVTVAEKWDCHRKVRQSPNFAVVWPFSATVTLFCDSVDRALQTSASLIEASVSILEISKTSYFVICWKFNIPVPICIKFVTEKEQTHSCKTSIDSFTLLSAVGMVSLLWMSQRTLLSVTFGPCLKSRLSVFNLCFYLYVCISVCLCCFVRTQSVN